MHEVRVGNTKHEKVIFHMDGDAFFVSVEVAKNPKLRGLPVVTGEERGIVSALSYEAKALGVKRGMPIYSLKRKFPNVIVLPGDYKSYAHYSSMMFDIVRGYVDDVEEYSIDECFADLTGFDRVYKISYEEIARRIKHDVNTKLGLSVSLGVAPTKVLAKVASSFIKPNGLTIISKENARDFLAKIPIGRVWGIGSRGADSFKRRGIHTALDFINLDETWVKKNLHINYIHLWRELRGERLMEVSPEVKTKYSSIQKTRSFHPATNDPSFLLAQLSKHIEEACRKARYYKLAPKKILFFLKTKDFKYHVCKVPLVTPTNSPEVLVRLAHKHFKTMHKGGVLYRTTGVTLADLVPDGLMQADLFGGTSQVQKLKHIHESIDTLEAKLGKRLVHLASTHQALKRRSIGTDVDDPNRHLLFL